MRKDTIKLAVLILVLCCGALGVLRRPPAFWRRSREGNPPRPQAPASSAAAEEPAPPPDAVVRLRAVGDNLIHDSIYRRRPSTREETALISARFTEHVAPLVADADLSFINQETIIAERLYPLSGYPMFNSPEAVGRHMAEIGFDVVSVANNHMFDMGEAGLAAALDFWEGLGVDVFGAWRTEAAMEHPVLTECHGITFGWVPMTEHTNGLSLPASTEMRYIRTGERELMKRRSSLRARPPIL